MQIIFNHGITRLSVRVKQISRQFSIETHKVRPIFGKKVEKKFVHEVWCSPKPLDTFEFPHYLYTDYDEVYLKPHCVIHTADGGEKTIYFETKKEIDDYVKELKEKAPHIVVQ